MSGAVIWIALSVGCQSPDASTGDTQPAEGTGSSSTTDPGSGTGDGGSGTGGTDGNTDGAGTGGTSSTDDTGTYIFEDDSEPPDLSIPALEDALSQSLAQIWDYNAAPVVDAYNAVMARSSGSCPETFGTTTGSYWADTCTTGAGVTYDGYLSVYATGITTGIQGAATVSTPDIGTLLFLGEVTYVYDDSEASRTFGSILDGTFTFDGPLAAGTWLETGPVSQLSLDAHWDPFGGAYVVLGGRLFEMEGSIEALVFSGASAIYEQSACPQEISGDLAVLVDGTWVDLYFDGPAEISGEVDAGLCDGCGEAWARGYLLGEVCPDFDALFTWVDGDAPF